MNVLRVFLTGVAVAFGAAALGGLWVMTTGHWLIGGVLFAGAGALSYVILGQSRTVTIQSTQGQKAQLETTVKMLAERNGGVVPVSAIMNATGFTRDRAEQEMRPLIGRGVVELGFADNGEMTFKLTPLDEARAQLAAMRDKA